MGIWFDSTGLEAEFDDNASETETLDKKEIKEILYNKKNIKKD